MEAGYNFLGRIAIFVALIASVVVHEVSHGAMADAQGDPTARMAGRLMLNPLKHLDPLGTVFMVLIVFLNFPFIGWAKPVPINPAYFRDYRRGMILTALAGPFANFSLMLLGLFGALMLFQAGTSFKSTWAGVFGIFILINFVLMLFNLIPIPPLDGSRVLSMFMSWRAMAVFNSLERYGFLILLFLVIFDHQLRVLSGIFMGAFWLLQTSVSLVFGTSFASYFIKAAFYSIGLR